MSKKNLKFKKKRFMKILSKQIDEFKSSLSDKVMYEYIVYLINNDGERIKAKMCFGDEAKLSIVNDFIAEIVIKDEINGIVSPIIFENVSFQKFKNSMN